MQIWNRPLIVHNRIFCDHIEIITIAFEFHYNNITITFIVQHRHNKRNN